MARVLLVEDDPAQLEIRKLLLEHAGHQVMAASGAGEAYDLFCASSPDLVVMDLRIPSAEEGCLLIRRLRARSGAVPIVVFSGLAAELQSRPEAALVNKVLSKPFPARQLLELLGQLHGSSRQGDSQEFPE